MTPEQRLIEALRQGLHVPATLRELVAKRLGVPQDDRQRSLAEQEARRGPG